MVRGRSQPVTRPRTKERAEPVPASNGVFPETFPAAYDQASTKASIATSSPPKRTAYGAAASTTGFP